MRLIIAAILGGLIMFVWSAFSHMVLGVAEADFIPAQNEAAVISDLKSNVSAAGFYILPGMDMSKKHTPEEDAAWMAKYQEGPTAILVYNPTGAEAIGPRNLAIELASNIAVGLLVGIVLMLAGTGFGRSVLITTIMGIAGWTAIEVSYWTWFRFPARFVAGEFIDQTAGFLLMGVVIAFIMKKKG